MTDETYALLVRLLDLTHSNDASREQAEAYAAFKAHIEDLERKAQAYDGMLAYVEQNAQRASDEAERIIRNL